MVQLPKNFPRQKTFLSDTEKVGSALKWVWFEFRATAFRALRFARNRLGQTRFAGSIVPPGAKSYTHLIAESSTLLWTSSSADESHLVEGKIQNLRIAASKLNGLLVDPGEVFSFWAIIGPPTRWRGFCAGRELREGCMVANVGGGLCQLSNALHLNALEAQFQVIERHAHSRVVPGSVAETGKDATVFWNYKDLRFRARHPFLIRAHLTRTRLIVRFLAPTATDPIAPLEKIDAPTQILKREEAHDCVECRHRDCVNFVRSSSHVSRTALLLDSVWPEFDRWLQSRELTAQDIALVPLNGAARKIPAYRWFNQTGQVKPSIKEHPLFTAYRSWESRRLGAQGAARQKALLRLDSLLARFYSQEIPINCDRLIVSLSLLLPLENRGALGGREINVLMTRAPLAMLQETLDNASALYPDSATIRDFRVPAHIAEQELEALRNAHLLVTPHVAVADFLNRVGIHHVQLVPWVLPPAQKVSEPSSKTLLFPASALARKGAYELRSALGKKGKREKYLRVLGRAQEHANFWGSELVVEKPSSPNPLHGIATVVLPSHIENQPRILLQALANGLPVIATPGCGLPTTLPGLHLVPPGDCERLAATIEEILGNRSSAMSGQKSF